MLLAVAATTNAQLISSSSLVITKAKLPPVEAGYEQSVDASYAMMMTGANNLEANISYIGGYRFNEHIFLGAGIGISIMDSVKESYETHSVVTGDNGDCLSCPLVNIPLYVHFKAYFLKSRVSPLFALSAGGRLSAKKEFGMETGENIRYGTMGLYVNGRELQGVGKKQPLFLRGTEGDNGAVRGRAGTSGHDRQKEIRLRNRLASGIHFLEWLSVFQ